jgi:1-acyl-sn-glycerol-3-phosphate acyltransferase
MTEREYSIAPFLVRFNSYKALATVDIFSNSLARFMSSLLIFLLTWLVLGQIVCYPVLCARRSIVLSTNLFESGALKPQFASFARRDAKDLPSLPMLIIRAYTVGILFGFLSLVGLATAGLCAVVLPSSILSGAIKCCSQALLWITGFSVTQRGKRVSAREAPCIVANHNSAFDIIILLTQHCYFVSMDAVRNLPMIGKVAQAIGCIFVARDSADSRQKAKETITARLRSSRPDGGQLVVFPEGSTNNGHALLLFRRGAFEPNVPIQPLWIEFSNYSLNFTVISLFQHGCLAVTLPARQVTLHWCPVIQPDPARSPEDTANLARLAIANLTSAYGHHKLELVDASISHRDAIECANYINGLVISSKSD